MDEWRTRLRSSVAGWGLSPEEQSEVFDELEQHLEMEYAELLPRVGAEASLRRVVEQVDDPALRNAYIRRRHHPAPGVELSRSQARGWSSLARDVRYGWRALRTSATTTTMAVVALAIGIGLTTVMFTIIYGLLLRGLPYRDGERIAAVMEANPSHRVDQQAMSMHDFFAYRDAQRSFESFGAYIPSVTINLSGDERPERVSGARVTSAALEVTRVRPALGRSLGTGDEVPGAASVAILSHSLWRDRYASDSGVVGRSVRLNGEPATIIGVMPDGFRFPNSEDLWVPLRLDSASVPWGSGVHVNAVGRLRAGVSMEQANGELAGIANGIAAAHPASNDGIRVLVLPYIRAFLPGRIYSLLYAMFGAVGLVFLVACTNAANLLLARAAGRSKEVAVRVALGASRAAIVKQFLVEALVLSTLAAGFGALLAYAGIAEFRSATAGSSMPFWADFRVHPQLLLFVALTAIVASVVAGLLPALTAARSDITDVLKEQSLGSSSRWRGKLSRSLVVFELVLSSALLVAAGFATKSVLNVNAMQPGFRADGVMTGRVTLATRDSAARTAFFDRLEQEAARMPGGTSASLSTNLPGAGWGEGVAAVEGRTYAHTSAWPAVRRLAVTPGFFATFDVAISRGRAIGDGDRAGTPAVAVVNQRFADENFPGGDAINQRITLNPNDSVPSWVTIVGVIPTLFAADPASLRDPWPAEVLTAFRQSPHGSAAIAIRTAGDPASAAQPLRALVASLDPDLPVYTLTPMTAVLADARWDVRVFGGLFIVFGIAALALASIGLYAVLAFSVSRREREMGIRMALGAGAADVMRLIVRDGGIQLAIGISVGVLLGNSVTRLAGTVLFGVHPGDPVILALVTITLTVAGLAACVMPALRATKSDPVRSLRTE